MDDIGIALARLFAGLLIIAGVLFAALLVLAALILAGVL